MLDVLSSIQYPASSDGFFASQNDGNGDILPPYPFFFVLFAPSWLIHSILAIPPARAKLFPPQDIHDIFRLRRDLGGPARVVTEVVDRS